MCANHTSNRDFFTSEARTFELEKELSLLSHLSRRPSIKNFLRDYSRNILNVNACLSHYLPKLSDPSMSEIDDLLYDKDTDKDVYEYITSVFSESHELKTEILETKFYKYYEDLYLLQCGCLKSKRFLDVTFLRFVSVGNIICNSQIFRIVKLLLTSWCVVKVCQGLKLLKIIIEKHKECTDKHGQWINIEFIAGVTHWIKNLMKFPQARDEKHKRITGWIDLRLTATMESLCQLDIFTSSPSDDMMQLFIFNFWGKLPSIYFPVTFYLDFLLYYFLSAKTETIRRERMCNFIQGCDYQRIKYKIATKTTDYVRGVKNAMSCISYMLGKTLVILDKTTPKNKLRSIEKRLSYQYDSMGAIDIKTILEVKEFWELQICECDLDLLEEPHFTIEKFLVLHDFIKCLKTLSIMYEMIEMAKELMESRGGVEGNDNEMFKANGVIKRHLNNILQNKSMRGHMPWYINLTLEKCPFLLLPPRCMNRLEDLVKLIEGEPIDQVTEERLYFMINNSIN